MLPKDLSQLMTTLRHLSADKKMVTVERQGVTPTKVYYRGYQIWLVSLKTIKYKCKLSSKPFKWPLNLMKYIDVQVAKDNLNKAHNDLKEKHAVQARRWATDVFEDHSANFVLFKVDNPNTKARVRCPSTTFFLKVLLSNGDRIVWEISSNIYGSNSSWKLLLNEVVIGRLEQIKGFDDRNSQVSALLKLMGRA